MAEFGDSITSDPLFATFLALTALVVAALFANFVVKALLVRLIDRLLGRTPYGRDEEIRRHGVVTRLANIVPALVITIGIELVPHLPGQLLAVVQNVANAFILLTIALALGAVLNVVDTVYHRRPRARNRPIKSYLQVAKIAVYVIATLLIIATLIDQSPIILLSGLGAMAAVLILVFQDTLLGLVAGVQISSTDMVRVGDWIEVPGQNADGDVVEIALHTVKVRNWDNTITTVPIRRLVTEPFVNWRGMQESGGRRIKRALHLDQNSIRFLADEDVERLGRFAALETHLAEKRAEIAAWNHDLGERAEVSANTRRLTNIGTFRAYIEAYLQAHPRINRRMTLMVRQLAPGPEGLPLELYCFTDTVAWADYEGIQADVFDHLFSILPEFGLRPFQSPSGADLGALMPSSQDMR